MNRYRDFLSLCYREGIRNRKVTVNPARLAHKRKEPVGRVSSAGKNMQGCGQ